MLINDRWLWRETPFSFELTQLMAAGGFSSGITASHRGLLPWSPGWFLWKIPYLSISKQEELSCNAFVSFCFSALNHLSYLAYICTCYILLRVHEESNKLDVLWKHTATFSAQLPLQFKKGKTACFECMQISDFWKIKIFEYMIIRSCKSTCIQSET